MNKRLKNVEKFYEKRKQISAVTDTNLTSNEGVTETQHASCKIATEELVASARTSVTRILTGVCNTSRK